MEIANNTENRHQSKNSNNRSGQGMNGFGCDLRTHPSLVESSVPDYFARKRLLVRILGLLLFVLFLPITLLIMLVVRLTSPGPALFRQKRMGKDGREFTMYKIRTMYQDAEKASGPVWCRPSDPRITCFGQILRFLHLDELPQLINVVRGEMDLIGPRPERPLFVEKLVEEVPGFAERLRVLPGVTGLAQINLPPDETTDCVRKKLVLDLDYIQTATWGLDFRILLCTALRMIGIRHGLAVRWLRLDRNASRLVKSPRYASPPKSRVSATSIPENLRAMESLRVIDGQEVSPSSNGSFQYAKESTQPGTFHLPTSNDAEGGDISSLRSKPR